MSKSASVSIIHYPLSKHFLCANDAVEQRVYFRFCVVERERCAYRTFNAEMVHDWLCAMVSCAYGNAQFVQNASHVIRVYVAYKKREHAASVCCIPEKSHSVNFRQAYAGIFQQIVFILGDFSHPQFLYIIQRFG